MGRTLRVAAVAALAAFVAALPACDPDSRVPAREPKARPCPPPPEPAFQAVVVGTIGALHLAESGYPISRLGDVLTAFHPELVLIGVRVDPFREDLLEDGSFEMTYVTHLARRHGAFVEPIDWSRDEDLGAPAAAVDPWDAVEIVRREADLLSRPRMYTFDQANASDFAQRILQATAADARYRGGDPIASRRRAWIQELTLSAISRHERPKKVLAFVDVFDRPLVDGTLSAAGYTSRLPADVVEKSKDVILGDLPPDVLASYETQRGRAQKRAAAATGAQKTFWETRARVLDVVVEKRATCCVPQSSLAPRASAP